MCDSFAEAVADETAKQNRALGKQTENILKGIYNQFAEIVDEKIDDPAERELRNQFVLYLRKAEPKFEAVKLELARIKRKYRVE